jgi:hypothetical protein
VVSTTPFPLPSFPELFSVAAAVALFLVCVGAGAAIRGGQGVRGADFIVGYGAVAGAVIVTGLFAPSLHLQWAAAFALVAALIAAGYAARGWRDQDAIGLCLLIFLPVLLVLGALPPLEWDDLTQWLPNAAYLYEFGAFPRLDLPRSPSAWPGYPYAMPIWTWVVSLLSGRLVINAGSVASGLFFAAGAALFVEAFREFSGVRRHAALWAAAAAAVLLLTVFSASFRTAYSLTGYADTATSVTVAAIAWIACRALHSAAVESKALPPAVLMQLVLASVLLVSLKQANLVLLILLAAGIAAAVICRRSRAEWRAGIFAVAVILSAAILWWLWNRYVKAQMPHGQFSFMPLSRWRWAHAGEILRAMASAARPVMHFVILFIVMTVGIAAAWRGARSVAGMLAIATAVLFVGYTGFLFVTYLGAFSDAEALEAASFFRYSSHLGVLSVLVVIAYAGPALGRAPFPGARATVVAAIVLAVAVAVTLPLRWRYLVAAPYLPLHIAGHDVADTLAPGTRIAVIEPEDAGTLTGVLRFQLMRYGKPVHDLAISAAVNRSTPDPAAAAAKVAADEKIGAVVLGKTPAAIAGLFGQPGALDGITYLARADGTWRVVAHWP